MRKVGKLEMLINIQQALPSCLTRSVESWLRFHCLCDKNVDTLGQTLIFAELYLVYTVYTFTKEQTYDQKDSSAKSAMQ